MSSTMNQCAYLDFNKQNASDMLKKCVRGGGALEWPCSDRKNRNETIANYTMERPSGDNVEGGLPHTLNTSNENKLFTDNHVEGFTNLGESYVKPGDCPDGYMRCPLTGKCIQVCQNCKYNERTYGYSKEFNEFDICFPSGVYDGLDNQGNVYCTSGAKGQYNLLDAQGGMYYDDTYTMNVGYFDKLSGLYSY